MIRRDFSRESEIMGKDFAALIRKVGGKNAGHRLFAKIQKDLEERIPEIREFHQLENLEIETSYYDRFEEIMLTQFGKPLEWFKSLPEETRKIGGGVIDPKDDIDILKRIFCGYKPGQDNQILPNAFIQDFSYIKKILYEIQEMSRKKFTDADDRKEFHLRASTTIEDFVDDRYYDTFKTMEGVPLFEQRFNPEHANSIIYVLSQFVHFYLMKHNSEGKYELDNVSFALGIQPTINVSTYKEKDLFAISYSSYPEYKEKRTVIEVNGILPDPLFGGSFFGVNTAKIQLITVDKEGHICIKNGFSDSLKKAYSGNKRKELHKVRDKYSLLSYEQIMKMDKVVRAIEEYLGYPVNLELPIQYGKMYCVQLRPVPRLTENREIRSLEPLAVGHTLLAETPFVHGSFRRKGTIVEPYAKNTRGFKFEKPVIALHYQDRPAEAWFFEDTNCVGLLNPSEGSVLRHGHSVIPRFGEARNKFVFIGVPGLYKIIEPHLKAKTEKWTIPWTGDKEEAIFKYSDFEVIIESDGRRGRVYLDPEASKIF
ncbi:MAG: PEP/pyruvate-binding domain-containing protein [Candidatus Woesearchaeota archaeon]|nr:PEP/pyruvate-binding domain-containing protein [Candidatus Woesearchaeota archaeon]